jgi:hypothetical protein
LPPAIRGQHFLLDGNLTDRIVREAGDLAAAISSRSDRDRAA